MKFNLFNRLGNNSPKKKSSEKEPGDFYVEHGACTACGAPQAEAPDLIDHSNKDYNHCYFKKQPKTDEEIERAINAIAVSCVSGLRYGGRDEKILKRLYEIGEAAQCDYNPAGNYKLIVWEKVVFQFTGTIKELSEALIKQTISGYSHVNKQIADLSTNNKDLFQFTYRWAKGLTGIIFKCHIGLDNSYVIHIEKEHDCLDVSVRYCSITLNSILRSDDRVTDICWFDIDGNRYTETQIK